MKTKLIYALVSDPSDYYYEQTLISVTSARMWNPDAVIELLVDDRTHQTLTGKRAALYDKVNNVITVDFSKTVNKKQRSRFLKTSIRQHVKGDFLYIDSDTVVCESLEDVDKFQFEIGAVLDGHRLLDLNQDTLNTKKEKVEKIGGQFIDKGSYYNSGVLYVKDTPNTHAFFREWYAVYEAGLQKGIDFDQPALFLCNQNLDLIRPLEGEYNCQIFLGGLPYLGYAKIIHAFNAYRDYTDFFIFNSIHYLEKIKSQDTLTEEDKERIKTAKRQFYGEYSLTFGLGVAYNKSVLFHLFVDNQQLFHWVEIIGKCLLKLYRRFCKRAR